jgi:SAM-dependent methyltransferase
MELIVASRIVPILARVSLFVAAMLVVFSQCRKPWWLPGRFFIWVMNYRHAAVTRWGLSHVVIESDFTILDVGCGGGRTIHTLAASASEGKIYGVDHSEASVAAARRTNAGGIAAGHVDVRQASVSRLPFTDTTFDIVSAVETHYYWPDPAADMREILRVMKPGACFVLIAETYRGERLEKLLAIPMKLLRARYFTIQEHRELLEAAGFVDVAIDVEKKKGWICGVARRPAIFSER